MMCQSTRLSPNSTANLDRFSCHPATPTSNGTSRLPSEPWEETITRKSFDFTCCLLEHPKTLCSFKNLMTWVLPRTVFARLLLTRRLQTRASEGTPRPSTAASVRGEVASCGLFCLFPRVNVLCCTTLPHVMLRHIMLRFVMLCYVM